MRCSSGGHGRGGCLLCCVRRRGRRTVTARLAAPLRLPLQRCRPCRPRRPQTCSAPATFGNYSLIDNQPTFLPWTDGHLWKYFNGGTTPLDNAVWTAEAFDDAAWPMGYGPLGYGPNDVDYNTRLDSNSGFANSADRAYYYFRAYFCLTAPMLAAVRGVSSGEGATRRLSCYDAQARVWRAPLRTHTHAHARAQTHAHAHLPPPSPPPQNRAPQSDIALKLMSDNGAKVFINGKVVFDDLSANHNVDPQWNQDMLLADKSAFKEGRNVVAVQVSNTKGSSDTGGQLPGPAPGRATLGPPSPAARLQPWQGHGRARSTYSFPARSQPTSKRQTNRRLQL